MVSFISYTIPGLQTHTRINEYRSWPKLTIEVRLGWQVGLLIETDLEVLIYCMYNHIIEIPVDSMQPKGTYKVHFP